MENFYVHASKENERSTLFRFFSVLSQQVREVKMFLTFIQIAKYFERKIISSSITRKNVKGK